MVFHHLDPFVPVADAIARLFHPCAEVVIHEIATDKIFYIANPFSGRKPGDVSLLKLSARDLETQANVIGPYEKAGEKGQTIQSITSILMDGEKNALGLMCINLDYSGYEPALDLLESLIRPHAFQPHPEILFRNDWRDQIKLEARAFARQTKRALDRLGPKNRRRLMARLDTKGLFYAKKSVEQVAAILGVSRATAYNDLQAVRKADTTLYKRINP
jgi:D-arginine utilization repressor